MGKVSYANLKLKVDTSVNTFDFNGQTIEVLKYLPIEDKYSLINITLQKSAENNIYSPLKMEMFFNLHLVYMYSNLSFTDKQRENEPKLYDCLDSSGLMDLIIMNMDEREYKGLLDLLQETAQEQTKYTHSVAGVVSSFMTDFPEQAQAAADIVDNFNPSQYQAVVDFATAANGGRPIEGVNK